MTTDDAAGPDDGSRAQARPKTSRPAVRRRRSHAALGSRVFAGGLAISGTVGLAGMMARRPAIVAASTPREALLTIVATPARTRSAPPAARIAAGPAGAPPPSVGVRRTAAPSVAPAKITQPPANVAGVPATAPQAPAAPAPVAAAPVAPPAPVAIPAPAPTSPPAAAPRPVLPPPPPPPVVAPPPAPPVTTSHASPPP